MSAGDLDQLTVDTNNLYREEIITDSKAATIRKMIPIKLDESIDDNRETYYIGQTNIMSPMGTIPINTVLEGKTLEEALKGFPEAIKKSVEKLIEEAKEYQRQEASKIVVPGQHSGGSSLHL